MSNVLCSRQCNLTCKDCFLCGHLRNEEESDISDDENDENFEDVINNKYYTPTEFGNTLKLHGERKLILANFNCRSLKCNFKTFTNCLDEIGQKLSFIGTCETWLNDGEENECMIPDYTFVGKHRNSKRGGGVGIYVNNNLKYIKRSDLDIFTENTAVQDCEELFQIPGF